MKFILVALVTAATIQRRKDFYTTHEEHGHLPGPRNPSLKDMGNQLLRVAKFENPFNVLNTFNEKADDTKGARFGRETKKTGSARYLDALGFSDIPFLGSV